MAWHVGRTTGRALYDGDGPDDMVGVMVGDPQRARELAALVVAAVNERDGARVDYLGVLDGCYRALYAAVYCETPEGVPTDPDRERELMLDALTRLDAARQALGVSDA